MSSQPHSWRKEAFLGDRTMQRTAWPASSARLAICRPNVPVPPTTRTRMNTPPSRLSLGVPRVTTCPLGAGFQSFSTLSSKLPPKSPTGINTQNRAAVPKISEAMELKGKGESYLTDPPIRSAANARMVGQGASLLS